jgi:hypothetical protein
MSKSMIKIRHKKPVTQVLDPATTDSISASDAAMQTEQVTEQVAENEEVKGEIANEIPDESQTSEVGLQTEAMVEQVLEDLGEPEAVAETTQPAAAALATKPKKPEPTVMVTVPFLLESKCYLDVQIEGKKASLFKESLKSWMIEDGMVAIEMPRALARRRGLLQAA